ncbi:MAG: hypothetical protein JW862_01935 [Anaerolineales bacterium]|nr:hypothetical protein [Anaerolineales bacterium]
MSKEEHTSAEINYGQLWQQNLHATRCPRCENQYLVPAARENALCPGCFAAHLESMPGTLRPEPPESLIPFEITPAQVSVRLQAWLKGNWLRPTELDAHILGQRLTRTFLPMWLVDGQVCGWWQADMGYDYQVASSQEVYQGGRWTTNRLTETRIRWEARTGTLERSYENLSVPALPNHDQLVKRLGKFKISNAPRYQPAELDHSVVQVPVMLPEAAWGVARSGFDRLAAADCQRAAGAQHIEAYQIQADYEQLNWTQLLLPVYTSAYRDENGGIITIRVNGQNGIVDGMRRASQKKGNTWSLGIAGVAVLLFITGLVASALTTLLPLLGILGVVFLVLGLFTGLAAPIPAIWSWNFNRKEKEKFS